MHVLQSVNIKYFISLIKLVHVCKYTKRSNYGSKSTVAAYTYIHMYIVMIIDYVRLIAGTADFVA